MLTEDDEDAVCPPPSRGVNAVRRGYTRKEHQSVQFDCEPEFPVYISGDEEITCMSNGAWSGQALVCGGKSNQNLAEIMIPITDSQIDGPSSF